MKPVKYHLGVSGGKDSTAALIYCLKVMEIPREMLDVTMNDTENEHAHTYAHIEMLERRLDVKVTRLKPELGFEALIRKKASFPGRRSRFCTERLKIIPAQEHIQYLRTQGFDPIAISGVRADESESRSHLSEWDYNGNLLCREWRPLLDWSLEQVLDLHREYDIPLNPLYALGARRVGCWPCVLACKSEIRAIAKHDPERIAAIRRMEDDIEEQLGTFRGFFRSNATPARFHSRRAVLRDGTPYTTPSIDDVVKWSQTGKRAKGSYLDEVQPEPISCNSGFCE